MGQRLLGDGTTQKRFIVNEARMEFDPDAVKAYPQHVKCWKEEMLVVVHMSSNAMGKVL